MRKRWINLIAIANACSLGAATFILGSTPIRSLAAADRQFDIRPNIVMFMTDDQTVADLELMKRTKNLIGGAGVTFNNSFVSFPLCCPSRATYLSGQYAHNHGVLFNEPPYGYLAARGTETLPGLMQDSGYRTIHVGKYFNGFGLDVPTEVPKGWTRFHSSVGDSLHWYHGYTMNHNGELRTHGDPSIADPKTYLTDVIRKLAIKEIEQAVGEEDPFFLSVSFLAPHGEDPYPGQRRPHDNPRGAPRHAKLYGTTKAPKDPSFNESSVGDKPTQIQGIPQLSSWSKNFVDQLYRARARSLRSVDQGIARVIQRVSDLGQLENTWFLFTSDNGFFSGQHRIHYGKYLPYEPSIRVPLIIAGPGVQAGTSTEQLVSNIDLAPTILDIAGVRGDAKSMDGRSLVSFVTRPSELLDRTLLIESGPAPDTDKDLETLENLLESEKGITRVYQGIRTSRYKYIEYSDGQVELYDLLLDPYERKSLHADPFHASLLPMLRAALDRLRDCAGADCRSAELLSPLGASVS